MNKLAPIALFAFAAGSMAQTAPKPVPVPPAATQPQQTAIPELSRTLVLQMASLAKELQQVNEDYHLVAEQVAKEHPGFHLTSDLRLEKDATPTKK